MKKDQKKTKEDLIRELADLRVRVERLQRLEKDRLIAEEIIRDTESRFRDLYENSLVAMLATTIKEGLPVAVNDAAIRMFGYRNKEQFYDGFQILDHYFDPSERPAFIRKLKAHGELRGHQLHFKRKNNESFWAEVSVKIYPEKERIEAVLVDITERKKIEEQLRFTQFSVDRISDSAFWMGPDARFIYVNEAACSSLGYAREELLQMSVHDIDPNFTREVWPDHWKQVKEQGSFTIESTHRRKDGHLFPVEISVNFLAFEGAEYNCAFARDITERKKIEEENQKLEVQVQYSQKLESLGILAGGIAHDFNNMLMAILGNSELALMDLSHVSPVRENIEEIRRVSLRAADLCKQMLAYSGRGKIRVEVLDLSELVEEMAQILEVSISKKAVLQFHFGKNLPYIKGDATQMRQVIMNLITNASEAIGDRTGIITVTTGVMYCESEYFANTWIDENQSEGHYVFLTVKDSGCGMDQQTMAKLFDPFFTTKFAGRGLGMSAVLGIVRGHQGAIQVSSEPNKGTTFTVLFPATEDLERVNPEPRAREAISWHASGKILLVDDEESVRSVGKRILESVGFDVLVAVDGKSAVDVFRKHQKEISCVLLDLTMPRMDGVDCFKKIRQIQNTIPVIICSGYNEQEVTQRFLNQDHTACIQKPYQMEVLMKKLRELLQPTKEQN